MKTLFLSNLKYQSSPSPLHLLFLFRRRKIITVYFAAGIDRDEIFFFFIECSFCLSSSTFIINKTKVSQNYQINEP